MILAPLSELSLEQVNLLIARFNQLYGKDHGANGRHAEIFQFDRDVAMGACKTMVYDPANFTASSSTWTVDRTDQTIRYARIGPRDNGLMVIFFSITATDVGGTPTSLRFKLPEDCLNVAVCRNLIQIQNNGTIAADPGVALTTAHTNYVELYRDTSSTAWSTTSSDNTSVQGQIIANVRDANV